MRNVELFLEYTRTQFYKRVGQMHGKPKHLLSAVADRAVSTDDGAGSVATGGLLRLGKKVIKNRISGNGSTINRRDIFNAAKQSATDVGKHQAVSAAFNAAGVPMTASIAGAGGAVAGAAARTGTDIASHEVKRAARKEAWKTNPNNPNRQR